MNMRLYSPFPLLLAAAAMFGGSLMGLKGQVEILESRGCATVQQVPSWFDLRPDSGFLLNLYAMPVLSGTEHNLLCGSIKRGLLSIESENDGVVALVSKAGTRIRNKVVSSGHFGYEQNATLRQPGVLSRVEAVQED